MSLAIKPGARVQGLTGEIRLGLSVAEGVYAEANTLCVVTCGVDGKHMAASKHYSGNAVDLRINNLPATSPPQAIVNKIKERISPDYDVVLEGDHIHLEYDPKTPLGA